MPDTTVARSTLVIGILWRRHVVINGDVETERAPKRDHQTCTIMDEQPNRRCPTSPALQGPLREWLIRWAPEGKERLSSHGLRDSGNDSPGPSIKRVGVPVAVFRRKREDPPEPGCGTQEHDRPVRVIAAVRIEGIERHPVDCKSGPSNFGSDVSECCHA